MFIGIDDTDSEKGMCTTYIAALICEKFKTKAYPRLIRLNPNIPYKTRGNGAVALEIDKDPDEIKKFVIATVKKYAHLQNKKTNPGIVFIKNLDQKKRKIFNDFYQKTLSEIVTIENAENIAKEVNADLYKFNNGRGIIGAIAAIGAQLQDKTYELIAYRTSRSYGKEKEIDKDSVFLMDKKTYPETFDNVDPGTGQILITPHGYDPVFCGIRGNSIKIVKRAWKILNPLEEIKRIQIFETNQGTDVHLRKRKISELKPYDCAILQGIVTKRSKIIEGGHTIFALSDRTGKIECAAYEPTGKFRDIVRKLSIGDNVIAYGGIGKYKKTLNLEKIKVLGLSKEYEKEVPICCGKRMTSAGKDKGFKCKKCGKRLEEDVVVLKEISRELEPGFYEVPPRARRHLSMPLVRLHGV